jgi:hypothetical protein
LKRANEYGNAGLQNASDVVAFCIQRQAKAIELYNEHKDYKRAKRDVLRYFHLIENVDQRKKYDCQYLLSVQSLHSMVSVSHRDVTLLRVKQLKCFYKECIDDILEFCLKNSHIIKWNLETLTPKNLDGVCKA